MLTQLADNVAVVVNSSPAEFTMTVQEYGKQHGVSNLLVSITDLDDGEGHTLPASAVTFAADSSTLEPGGFTDIEGLIEDNQPLGEHLKSLAKSRSG